MENIWDELRERESPNRVPEPMSGVGKIALITGITGQDGAYLAELLLLKGYEVHGIKRRSSLFNTDRIDHLYQDPHLGNRNFVLHYGDLSDACSLLHIMQKVQPDEIYNLGAQSHVAVSFEQPDTRRTSMALARSEYWKRSASSGQKKRLDFTRLRRRNYTAWCGKHLKQRRLRSIPGLPTRWLSYTLTGSR